MKTFFTTRDQFLDKRFDELEECELALQRANICYKRCNQPVDLLKQVLAFKFKLVSNNIQNCLMKYAKDVELEDGTKQTIIDKNAQMYCLSNNLDMLKQMTIEEIINIDKFSESFIKEY